MAIQVYGNMCPLKLWLRSWLRVKRKDIVIVPKSNRLVASAPGLVRSLIEFIGFDQKRLKKTMQLAEKAD